MRRIGLNLKIAVGSLCKFRLRTSLAVLGVFLGTFSLVVVSNISKSLALKTEREVETLGKNLLIVRSGITRQFGPGTRLLSEATNLTPDDAEAIRTHINHVSESSPSGHKVFPLRYRETVLTAVPVVGVMPEYPSVRNFKVGEGRFVTHDDNKTLERKAVIGSAVAQKLFGRENPMGKHFFVYRVPFEVIGVMEPKGVDLSGFDQDTQVFVPLGTYLRRLVNKENVNTIYVQTAEGEYLPQAKRDIEGLLRKRHNIKERGKDDFSVIDLKDVTALKSQAMRIIAILGRVAAAVSFLIGGMGILSIMILIVSERKLEIGIRRAVGSRRRDIALQFLLESSFISFTGGVSGVIAGFTASLLIYKLAALPFDLSLAGFALAWAASVAVGIAAGIYPARRASLVQPAEIISR